jgi:hypothetical protein
LYGRAGPGGGAGLAKARPAGLPGLPLFRLREMRRWLTSLFLS